MNENDNLERVQRYREILPFAYLAASIQRLTEGKKGKPGQFAIGMCARDIVGCEYEKSPAYRIAMAVPIPAEILKVEKETTNFGADYYHIWYRELSTKEHEEKDIKTPLLSDRRFGAVTEKVWGTRAVSGREWCSTSTTTHRRKETFRARGTVASYTPNHLGVKSGLQWN